MPGEVELVIFDCDGVLVDSETISARVLLSRLSACGVNVDFDHFRRHFLGRSFPKVAAEVREKHMVNLPDDFEASYRSALLGAFERELHPMEGIFPVLKGLAVRSCVATSSSPPRARRSLEIAGLLDHFDGRIFTASEVANGKPAPDLFLHAARKMGAEPAHCLVIEDSLPGLKAGLAAGMEVWQFTGGSHLRGQEAGLPGVRVLPRWSALPELVPSLFGVGQSPEGVLK